jgi:hypothetical protein
MNQTHSEKVRKWDFLGLFLVNRFLCVYIYSYIYTYTHTCIYIYHISSYTLARERTHWTDCSPPMI